MIRCSLSRTNTPSSGSCSTQLVTGQACWCLWPGSPLHRAIAKSSLQLPVTGGRPGHARNTRMGWRQAGRTSAVSLGLKRTVVCSSPEGILMQAVGTCRGDDGLGVKSSSSMAVPDTEALEHSTRCTPTVHVFAVQLQKGALGQHLHGLGFTSNTYVARTSLIAQRRPWWAWCAVAAALAQPARLPSGAACEIAQLHGQRGCRPGAHRGLCATLARLLSRL